MSETSTTTPSPLTSLYPVLLSEDVSATARFYRDRLGFDETFSADWYVSMRRGPFELAVLDASHETIPEAFRGHPARGVLLNIEVEDVDAEYQRLVIDGDAQEISPLRSESFGQRHFILAGPEGAMIDVITPIEPDDSVADQFA